MTTLGVVVRSCAGIDELHFVIEFEERWHSGGQDWYSREMARADISENGITELSVYCTGDWDEARVAEHRAAVTLLRP